MHDFYMPLINCARGLREGANPVEVASTIEAIADALNVSRKMQRASDAMTEGPSADVLTGIAERLMALRDAMRGAAESEHLHPSVRFLADTIALNLAGPTGGQGNDAR